MSDPFFDKLIADLVKGAEVNARAAGGPGVRVVVDRENHGREEKLASAAGPLSAARDAGAAAARARFGVKTAGGVLNSLLPMAGQMLGGAGLRAGAGMLAGRGGALGGLAAKALPKMTGGIGGAATDMLGSMAGGALGQRLAPRPPPQPQPQQPMV